MNEASSPEPSRPRSRSRSSGWQAPPPAEVDAVLTAYQVTELLGRGGMGAVYRAVQPNLDRNVAIKILPLELAAGGSGQHFSQRFKQEARSMAKLSHPGIVQVHDFGEAEAVGGDFLYFVMEFVEGCNILQYLREQGGRLEPEHAHAIVCHVLDALGFAHQHGVIHRDIKPANIMLDQYGRVKVADFGLAKSTGQETDLTASNMAMGTPDFIAPEALESGKEVDERADLYSVGAMLYQLLTGKVPRGVFQPATELVPGLDVRYDGIIMRALRPDPDARYQDAAEFRADLDRIVTEPTPEMKLGVGTIPLVRPGGSTIDQEAETAPLSSAVPVPKPAPDSAPEPLTVAGLAEDEPRKSSVMRKLLVVVIVIGLVVAGLRLGLPGGSGGEKAGNPPPVEDVARDGSRDAMSTGDSSPVSGADSSSPAPVDTPVGEGSGGETQLAAQEEGSTDASPDRPRPFLEGIPGLREKLEEHLAQRQAEIGQLARQYGAALERGLDRAADSGDLRLVSAYRDERSRLVVLMQALESGSPDELMVSAFRNPLGLPPLPRNSPGDLVELRGTWNDEIEKIGGALKGSVRRALLNLENDLAAGGQEEKARRLAVIREDLETRRKNPKERP